MSTTAPAHHDLAALLVPAQRAPQHDVLPPAGPAAARRHRWPALLAVVVLAPVFLGWYYLWALPAFAVSLGALWRDRLEGPLAVVATVVCFATLPEGYSLGLTTTVVGVPIAIVALVLLLRRGLRTARRTEPTGHGLERHGSG